MGSLNRGAVRASCFDATIAARRLENVGNSTAEMAPETREKIRDIASKTRALAMEIRGLLSPKEQQDLAATFD